MYYKMVFIGILCFILCIHLGINWYHNAQIKSVLSVSVVNSPSFEPEPIEEEIMEILGCAGDEFSKVEIFSNMNTDQTGEALDYYNQMSYIARLQAKEIDVIIFPESLYKAINVDEIFLDMKEVLDPETYEAFGEQVKGNYLALENTKLNEEMTIYYEPVCLAVPMNAQHIENAGKWIATLAE